jgi:iron complex outermembrane receptor protein
MRTRLAGHTLATALLLASTALTAPAWAQTAAPATPSTTPAASNGTSGSFGNTQPTDIGRVTAKGKATPDGVTGEDIGGGLMVPEDQPKSRSTVTRDFIAKQSPTANPYQLISALPGVNAVSSDAFGLNGGNITIRGFNSNEIGLTIDGAPINDSGNFALYPQEYLDAQNIAQISVAQGYDDLDSPHIGATGGVINIYSRDPDKTAGGYVSLSAGSHQLQNEFIRLETGEIGRLSAYISYSNYSVDHWRGFGVDQRNHIDGKVAIDVGEASKITVSAIYNEENNNSYYTLSTAQFANGGAFAAQNNYDGTFNAAGTALNQKAVNGYYKDYINPFKNLLLTAPSTFALTDDLTLEATPYFWYGIGNGGGATVLSEGGFYYGGNKIVQDLNGNGTTTDKLLYYIPSITETYRPGAIAKLNYQLGNNHLVAGVWYEDAWQHQFGPASPLVNGAPINPYGTTSDLVIAAGSQAGKIFQKRDWTTNTYVTTFFAGDTISLLDDRMAVDVGLKQAYITRHGDNALPSGSAYPAIQQFSHFHDSQLLPTAAVSYKLNEENQLFAGVATTFKTPANYNLYATTSATSTTYTPAIPEKDESAVHVEMGHRYQGDLIDTSVSVFGYQFSNRQVSTNIIDPSGAGTVSATINAGSTTAYGIDAEIGTKPINHFRPYASFEYMHDTLDSNMPSVGTLGSTSIADNLRTRGKFMPEAPSLLGFVGVDYDDGHLFANLDMKYTGMQYGSFMNDNKIPGFLRADAVVGYRFADVMHLKAPEIRLNVINIGDSVGLTGVYSVTTNNANSIGVKGSTIKGSTPYYYVGQGLAAIVTLSSGF